MINLSGYEEILLGSNQDLRAILTADILCDEVLGFEDVDNLPKDEAEENADD